MKWMGAERALGAGIWELLGFSLYLREQRGKAYEKEQENAGRGAMTEWSTWGS